MTTTTSAPRTGDAVRQGGGDPDQATPVLDAVRELAPVIAARAGEIEAARRVPRDLLDELVAAGCFRMLRPTSHGGLGFDLASGMQVFEELGRADASVGWVVALGSAGWLDFAELPRQTFDAVFGADPDAITAGAINPTGLAVPADGGYRVRGRWAFVSGCEHADWLFANCIEDGGAAGETAPEGPPPMRLVVLTPDEVEIEDTWSVSGLRGTGSHHIRVDDVVVPAERTYPLLTAERVIDTPMTRIPLPTPYTLFLSGLAVGIAQGALDDILALATTKVPLFAGNALAANPHFQHQLATADVRLRAARALAYHDAAETWRTVAAGDELTTEVRARIRADGVWAASTAASVVDAAYTAGGGSSLYADSPLQRRLRDIHALTQHFIVRSDSLTTVGAVLAGQEADTMLL